MMKSKFLYITLLFLTAFLYTSCFNDLNVVPLDENVTTSATVYDDPTTYKGVLAKLYAGLAVSGQEGPAGQSDISGIDEGFGQYLRGFWYHSELSTDEAVIGWNDQTIFDFHGQSWTSSDGFIFAFYSRIFYQIALCNEFIRETTDEKLSERGVDANLKAEIETFRAEARFLRALSYWHALDHFRNVPFVTENDKVGSFFPEQISGPDLFKYIEGELIAIESDLKPAGTNEYARADQGAAWTLLAKLYLNAGVYTGTERNTDCLTYCEKVINAGYTLEPQYRHLFLADNHNSNEIIFPIAFDGVRTRTWGGMTFIIRAGIGGDMNPLASGVVSGWGGSRTTKQIVQNFPEGGGFLYVQNPGNTNSYPKVYVPGDHQGFDATDTRNSLSSVTGNKIYVGHKYFPTDNSEFLVARNPTLGGALGDNGGDGTLETGGDNIVAGPAGLYYIQVDLNDNTYSLESRTWGVIGDATPGGWDTDTDMTWDPVEKAMVVDVTLTPGEIKFRANDDWAINLGHTAGNRILVQDGGNISITEAGDYKVLLYIGKPDYTFEIRFNSFDDRGIFVSNGQTLEITDLTQFREGYAVTKFKNVTSTGVIGSDTDFPDTDFPMFRLADVYLMASEAIVRNNGNRAKALDYMNRVRNRAFGSSVGHITDEELTLAFILDERARELYWECHRRTDLVRFGQFTNGSYLWAWKGNDPNGAPVDPRRDVYPIPSSDITANPNLEQNDGY